MRVSEEGRQRYAERIEEYESVVSELAVREERQQGRIVDTDPEAGIIRLGLASSNLTRLSYYVLMNSLSVTLLGVKNEVYLGEARKCCANSLRCLEEIVSAFIDAPFSDYEDGVMSVERVGGRDKYRLLTRLGYSIDVVEESYGATSKMKWSFVELKGRFAAVAKNFINLKTVISRLEPSEEGYADLAEHIELTKRQLQTAADSYRRRYELSPAGLDDMRFAIRFLNALRRLHHALDEAEDRDAVARRIEVWSTKLEDDIRKSRQDSRSGRP